MTRRNPVPHPGMLTSAALAQAMAAVWAFGDASARLTRSVIGALDARDF